MRLTATTVKAAEPGEREYFLWDRDLRGFGLRVSPNGRKVFIVQTRIGKGRAAKSRRITLGKPCEALTAQQARDRAAKLIHAAKGGADPKSMLRPGDRPELTVNGLLDRWEREAAHINQRDGSRRKADSVAGDIRRINAHVRPLIGQKRLCDVEPETIRRLRSDITAGKTRAETKTRPRGVARVRGGDGTAVRTIRALASVFRYAVDAKLMDVNPVKGVRLPNSAARERFLNGEELARLGKALDEAERAGKHPHGLNIIRLLALTGARRGEVESLRWDAVDFERGLITLAETKAGRTSFPLSGPALAFLRALEREGDSPWVFPATRGGGHYKGVGRAWTAVRDAAGLEGVRLHDLRHSFASFGAASGIGLQTVGKLLGHRQAATTARYSHIADNPLRAAADQIGSVVAARMGLMSPKIAK